MDRQASLDLLNATHTFPCVFTLKVIGLNENDFLARCLGAVCNLPLDSVKFDYTTRSTPNGRHISVTMEPTLNSAEQVLEIYACLKDVQGVVMTM